jgi:molybdopterin-guanine dinucleotide biosynthesis protein A
MNAYEEIKNATHAYIALRECGCPFWISIDMPSIKKDLAKEIAKHVRAGYAVERLPRKEASERFQLPCVHKEKKADLPLFREAA